MEHTNSPTIASRSPRRKRGRLSPIATLVTLSTFCLAPQLARAGDHQGSDVSIGSDSAELDAGTLSYDAAINDDPTALPRVERPLPPVDTSVAKDELKHKGFVFETQAGTIGCTKGICSGASGHNATPGPRVSGFLGGNIAGFVELGVSGGYGSLQARVEGEPKLLDLFGLQAPEIPAEYLDGFDFNALTVHGAKLDDLRVGPAVRVHLVPRGRMQAFVGSGFGYHRFRGKYQTPSGSTALSFHGIDIPLEAGLGVYLSPRISVGVRFDYQWTYYAAVSVKHPNANLVAPLGILDDKLQAGQPALTSRLPHFWVASLGLRLTL